jgi:subtilisin family serine protease
MPGRVDADPSRSMGARPAEPSESPLLAPFAPQELLVRFDTAQLGVAPDAGVEQAVSGVGGFVAESLDEATPGLRRVVLDEGVTVEQAIAELEGRGDVLYAEPNYLIRAAGVPNDSRMGQLWGLHNTGQRVQGVTGTPDADIDAPEAWNITTGSSAVTVAVLDTGVAGDHPDLAPNMWVNGLEIAGNGVDDDGNGFVDDRAGWDFVAGDNDPSDEQGHGTHVAGTIGARGGNDTAGNGPTDIAGVAWHVQLMPVRVLDHAGNGTYAALIEGIEYARRNGARIGNLSLSGWEFSQALYDTMAAASDVTWVVAAGNDDAKNVDDFWAVYPCNFDLANVVCVAATNQRDRLAGFSNYGPVSVDVAAPGVNTFSAAAYSRVFFDDFETSSGGWVTGGTPDTWARTTSVPLGAQGTWLTDSPDGRYPDSSDNWARTPALDLTGRHHCAVKFYALTDTESWFDFFYVEAATSPTGPWIELGRWSGFLDGAFDTRLPASFDGAPAAYVRIRLNPDDIYDGDGLYIDDFAVECSGLYSAASFHHLSGTSMATPHVSGVAALVLARHPNFGTAELRAKLLSSVDTKPWLTGKVVTGGRINAHKAVTG